MRRHSARRWWLDWMMKGGDGIAMDDPPSAAFEALFDKRGPADARGERAAGAGIVVKDLSHWFYVRDTAGAGFRRVRALDGLSFEVRPSEFVSVVGPSGCGKTTALNVIAGLHALQRGEVRVGHEAPRPGRLDVGYMFARDALMPWRTAAANVEFGLEIRGMDRAQRSAHAHEWLEAVGLAPFEMAYPHQLSTGMRQRVALARTFALETRYLLMDEPFGALDAQTKLALEDVLMGLWEVHRRTVVLVTHDIGEAIALADRVLVVSRSPGQLKKELSIDLPRPRSARQLQKDARFHELMAAVWKELE